MNLLELISMQGLIPRKKANTKGGEYSSPCPSCGGNDRFVIHPYTNNEKGAYFCRQCNCKGDSIQFARDFLGYTFHQALELIGETSKTIEWSNKSSNCSSCSNVAVVHKIKKCSDQWKIKANDFVQMAKIRLKDNPIGLQELKRRGFKDETINRWDLGFNVFDRYDERGSWGLEYELNNNGNPKKVWLPSGLIIPSKDTNIINKIRVRRLELKTPEDQKYILVSGSSMNFSCYGVKDKSLPVILLESDLDAMLLWQEAGDLCLPVSLGSSTARPNQKELEWLKEVPLILYSLDWDDAGKKAFEYWKNLKNVKPWLSNIAKSVGDDFLEGVDIRSWVLSGIR